MSEGQHTPSPSSSTQALPLSRSAPKAPQTLSEWQLLAVLHKANLLQYYETFIDKGGDDVHQIMQCDEKEFMEIMALVGMLSKPLHVRRLQRTLTQFSADPTAFNVAAIPHIGVPPPSPYPIGLGATDPMQLFIPSALPSSQQTSTSSDVPSSSPGLLISSSSSPAHRSSLTTSISAPSIPSTSMAAHGLSSVHSALSAHGSSASLHSFLSGLGTAGSSMNPTEYLQALVEQQTSSTSPSPQHDDFVALGDFDPNNDTGDTPTLSDAQIGRLSACSQVIVAKLPQYKPKLVQNKKKISQEVLNLISMPPTDPRRAEEFRKYSAIYGRFDAKRKADKTLSLHEVSVNEAAAQICMLIPALLTRRDELFPLARQVVKDAGYHYVKSGAFTGQGTSRKRGQSLTPGERDPSEARSPLSSSCSSPPVNVVDDDMDVPEKKHRVRSPSARNLDRWAAEKAERMSKDKPGSQQPESSSKQS